MAANHYLPHVIVLPEDDADRQLANGFHTYLDCNRQFQILNYPGGWGKVLDRFEINEIQSMQKFPQRLMILLFDFDNDTNRVNYAKNRIPQDLIDRVFILGSLDDPEALKRAGLGNLEEIGKALAKDCKEDTEKIWGHPLLQHNADELTRLRGMIRPILFPYN